MRTFFPLIGIAMTVALAACSAPQPTSDSQTNEAADTTAPVATQPAPSGASQAPVADAAAPAAAQPVAATPTPANPPADDASMSSTGAQAGWYSAGTFRACGSSTALKVDNTADIERQVKAGGMSASDPVYVRLEGMPMAGDTYMLTRVVQVGSKTPVRDCPMVGTTTQVGG